MRVGRPWLSRLEEGSGLGRRASWGLVTLTCVASAGLVAWAVPAFDLIIAVIAAVGEVCAGLGWAGALRSRGGAGGRAAAVALSDGDALPALYYTRRRFWRPTPFPACSPWCSCPTCTARSERCCARWCRCPRCLPHLACMLPRTAWWRCWPTSERLRLGSMSRAAAPHGRCQAAACSALQLA